MRWAYLLLGFSVGLVAAQAVKFPVPQGQTIKARSSASPTETQSKSASVANFKQSASSATTLPKQTNRSATRLPFTSKHCLKVGKSSWRAMFRQPTSMDEGFTMSGFLIGIKITNRGGWGTEYLDCNWLKGGVSML